MDERKRKYMNLREAAFIGRNSYYDNPNYSQSGEMYRPDYKNKDYLHQSIPTLWNYHNVPATNYLWGKTQKYECNESLEGSISSYSVPRSKRCNKIVAVGVSMGFLVLVGGAIALALYFTSLSPSMPSAQLIFLGNLSIDKNWDPDLSNQSSPTYQQKAEHISKMIDKVYQSGDLQDVYIDNTIHGFRQGSTYVKFSVKFKNPEVSENPATNNASVVRELNPEKLVMSFIQTLQTVIIKEAEGLDIDTSTLTFQDVSSTTNQLTIKTALTTKPDITTFGNITKLTIKPTMKPPTTTQPTVTNNGADQLAIATITTKKLNQTLPTSSQATASILTTQKTSTFNTQPSNTTSTTTQPFYTTSETQSPTTSFTTTLSKSINNTTQQPAKTTLIEKLNQTLSTTTRATASAQQTNTFTTQPSTTLKITQPFYTTQSTTTILTTAQPATKTITTNQIFNQTTMKTNITQPTTTTSTTTQPTTTISASTTVQPSSSRATQPTTTISASTTVQPSSSRATQPTTTISASTTVQPSSSRATQPTTTISASTTVQPSSSKATQQTTTISASTTVQPIPSRATQPTTTISASTTVQPSSSRATQPTTTISASTTVQPSSSRATQPTTTISASTTVQPSSSRATQPTTTISASTTVQPSSSRATQPTTTISASTTVQPSSSRATQPTTTISASTTVQPSSSRATQPTTTILTTYLVTPISTSTQPIRTTTTPGSIFKTTDLFNTKTSITTKLPSQNGSETTISANTTASSSSRVSSTINPNTTPPQSGGICGGYFNNLSGNFTSPNYPSSYPNNADCYYYIVVPYGYTITISIPNFASESCCDFLKIYDGGSLNNTLALELRGIVYASTRDSTSNKLTLHFHSDGSIVNSGFRATYASNSQGANYTTASAPATMNYTSASFVSTTAPACNQTLYSASGVITSPNYPGNYPDGITCYYSIQSPFQLPVSLRFTAFAVESTSSGGCYDYVAIYNGGTVNDRQLGVYCGRSIPSLVIASSGRMLIKFYSDSIISMSGFSAIFADSSVANFTTSASILSTTTAPGGICGGYFNNLSGNFTSPNYPSSYPNNADCYYYMVVPNGYTITISIPNFASESCCDYLKIYDGGSVNNTLALELRGTVSASTSYSTSNKLTLHFHSDFSIVNSGFLATYKSNSPGICGGYFNNSSGNFTSANYLNNNQNIAFCYYYITVLEGYAIRINITTLTSGSCCNFLKIYDGGTVNDNLLLELRGPVSARILDSTSNRLTLYFYTDYSMSYGFLATYTSKAQACNATQYSSSGMITSPNHPGNYPNGTTCYYQIQSPHRLPISLRFTKFELDASISCYDYVSIYDGATVNDRQLGTYCGSSMPPLVISSVGHLLIKFYSDNSISKPGFSAIFEDLSVANYTTPSYFTTNAATILTTRAPGGICGGYFNSLSGNFTSPNYPSSYPNNADCYYYIVVPYGYTITISIPNFASESCCDYLKIYNGGSLYDPVLMELHGTVSGSVVYSTSNKLTLYFHSDTSGVYSGFLATFASKAQSLSISCDFEEPNGCGYILGSQFTFREAFRHHLPSIDHTYKNYSGHYMYFTSSLRQNSTLVSPPNMNTTGGCIKFFYNMEGGVSAELKVYKHSGNSRDMVFYANGIFVDRDQWVEGWFEIPPGYIKLEFNAYGDVSNFAPSNVAIDDIKFIKGQSCPQPVCENSVNKFACKNSGVCIPEFLTNDGYNDCEDGSDEDAGVSLCTFETTVETKCLFHNDIGDSTDWRIQRGATLSDSTGPDSAAVGEYYVYIETSYGGMELGENARFVTNTLSTARQMCVRFYYHMYGSSIGSLEVRTETSSRNESLFFKSGNQGNQWYLQKVNIPPSNNFKIVFNAIDGDGYTGDIALDHIMLVNGECASLLRPTSRKTIRYYKIRLYDKRDDFNFPIVNFPFIDSNIPAAPAYDNSSITDNNGSFIRLVGGRTAASGRLEILGSSSYSPVCASFWDVNDTKVACKQLGYSKSRYFSKSEYGKGRPERPFLTYQYYCNGAEKKLSDCLVSRVTCSQFDETVAIQCTNTECFEGERSCGDNSTCISEHLWCNGNVDCPNSGDETNCATCRNNDYECNNHNCVPLVNRCDGIPQCSDRSDEFRCVLRNNANGQVKVYSNLAWKPLCYTNDTILTTFLCSVTGYGPFRSSSHGPVISNGLVAAPSSNPYGVITNYILNHQMTCDALTLQCGDIECGVPSVSSTSAGSFVLYGNDAVQGEYPWQALLFMDGISGCGATLIDPYYAITAAHCVNGFSNFQIHVGEVKQSKMLGPKDNGQRIQVVQAIQHPLYAGSLNSFLSDIAILRLSQPAMYNDNVRPACIATELRTSYDNCYITGWGYKEDVEFGHILPDNLQEVKVDVNYDVERCNKSIQKLNAIVPASGICVENQNPFAVACNGDSGGPLVCQNQYGRWELVGVTSFGVRGCRLDQYPSIYQSVPYHINWIRNMTGINISSGNTLVPPKGN